MKQISQKMGPRLRTLRLDRSLQQGEVARRLGVSAAYMSLIEKGKRAVQLPLLFKALEIYGVAMEEFMASLGEERVDEGLARLLDEPLLKTLNLSREDLASLSAEPKVATTIAALFNLYKNTRGQLDHLLADLDPRDPRQRVKSVSTEEPQHEDELSFDYTPFDEVTDFLEAHGNYFPLLEERAEAFRRDAGLERSSQSERLEDALERMLDIRVRRVPRDRSESSVIRRLSREEGALSMDAEMMEHRRRFQLAHTIGLELIDRERLLDQLAQNHRRRHAETLSLLKIHLANYVAGALLLPYGPFFEQVLATRYDVDRLSNIFTCSYETVAHRLCNLSDPKRCGVRFHFQRVDVAGNISKRYSATGLKFPHGTGSCPKWAVHTAFMTPHAINRQYSVFPDGSRYFCFARVQSEPEQGSLVRGTAYSIGLGTHAEEAGKLAYAQDMPFVDPERMSVPVGTTCRFCERADCNQRAAPSYKYAFRVDEYIKKDNFFSPLVSQDQRADVAPDQLVRPRSTSSSPPAKDSDGEG